MIPSQRSWLVCALVGALLCWASGCSSTAPEKRLLQYLNDKGFGNRYTGNAEDQNYVTIGDTIQISDAFHPDINDTQRVDIDGTVVLAEVGALHVAGQTRSELEAFLTQKYSPYYEQLKIDVRIQTQNKVYFVFGEVAAEGRKQFPGDLTVFEAVMDAVPDPQTANLGRVKVIRADPRDPLIIPVNISAMFRGDSTDNVLIQERDIIYVPPTMIAEFGYFLADLMFPITNVLRQTASAILLLNGNGRYYGNRYNNNNGLFP
ncbi:MAG: polysaccharide biosynthesis/export family protein [Planctomycetes bacterium]|nr:polysaccharide biosynthesis/export family protein [Planctomycetota bacterium]